MIDVDGSYLYKKCQQHAESGATVSSIPPSHRPLSGWEAVSAVNHREYAQKIPTITPGD